jgi:glycine cleavage system H protein
MTTEQEADLGMRELIREAYFDDSHFWVLPYLESGARCGMDALGVETSGDVVALSFEPVGTLVKRGDAFGSIEAAKFVGPLIAPVSGTITGHNEEVLANPALLHEDAAAGWLIDLQLIDADRELALLRHGEEDVGRWLTEETDRFRKQGMLAE